MESEDIVLSENEPEVEASQEDTPSTGEQPEEIENDQQEQAAPDEAVQPEPSVEVEADAPVEGVQPESSVEVAVDAPAETVQPESSIEVEAGAPAESVEPESSVEVEDASTAEESSEPEPHPMEALLRDDDTLKSLKKGEIIEGTIVSISRDEILIDIGAKSDGVVSSRDIQRLDQELLDGLEVGGMVTTYILTLEDRNGNVALSISRAAEAKDWLDAEAYHNEDRVYEGTIDGFNKGGIIVDFGRLRGFLPASQIGADRRRNTSGQTPEERWGDMAGEAIQIKIIEVHSGRNRLIMSEREAEKETRAARRDELIQELEVGQVHTGHVTSIADFGAFIDLGGIDGLVHISELAWKPVSHPGDIVSRGDDIEVEIISIDREKQRIGLSRKRRQEDPWQIIASKYQPGQLVQGTVTRLTNFGAFARLVVDPELEGLIHISELAEQRINHPGEIVEENETLTLRVVRIEPERRRLGLSLKRVDSEEYLDTDWRSAPDEEDEPDEDSIEAEALQDGEEGQEEAESSLEAEDNVETEDEESDEEPEADTEDGVENEDEDSDEEPEADTEDGVEDEDEESDEEPQAEDSVEDEDVESDEEPQAEDNAEAEDE